MSFGILNNIPALQAEAGVEQHPDVPEHHPAAAGHRPAHQLRRDRPGRPGIANGLSANIAALNQSIQNANDGTGRCRWPTAHFRR